MIPRLHVPLLEPEDVVRHLGKQEKHWKQGRSAHALATVWSKNKSFPPKVAAALESHPVFSRLKGRPESRSASTFINGETRATEKTRDCRVFAKSSGYHVRQQWRCATSFCIARPPPFSKHNATGQKRPYCSFIASATTRRELRISAPSCRPLDLRRQPLATWRGRLIGTASRFMPDGSKTKRHRTKARVLISIIFAAMPQVLRRTVSAFALGATNSNRSASGRFSAAE